MGTFVPKPEPDDPHDLCPIKSVYHWSNGMAMVFCIHGQQIPYLQGPSAVMRERIERRLAEQGGGAEVHGGDWPGLRGFASRRGEDDAVE